MSVTAGPYGFARCRVCGEEFPLWLPVAATTCPRCLSGARRAVWSTVLDPEADPWDYPDFKGSVELRRAEEDYGSFGVSCYPPFLEVVVDGTSRGAVTEVSAHDLYERLGVELGLRPDIETKARRELTYAEAMTWLRAAKPWSAHIGREAGHIRIGDTRPPRYEQWCIVREDGGDLVVFFSRKVLEEHPGLHCSEMSLLDLGELGEYGLFTMKDLTEDDWFIEPGAGLAEESRRGEE